MSTHDAAFEAIYKSCTSSGIGGDLRFVDAFFGFLARRTPMLQADTGVQQIQQLAMKHVELAKKNKKKTTTESKTSTSTTSSSSPSASISSSASSSSPSSSSSAPSGPVSELPDAADEGEEDKLPAPINNGGVTDHYRWSQTLADTNISIPLPAGTSSKMLEVTIEPNQIHAALKSGDKTVFVSGEPYEKIDSSDATWTIEDDRGAKTLEIFLPKVNKMSWWSSVVKGGPKINTKKIVPENSKLDDLDGDTRSTVEKMMFDQRQKQMGKPSSDEMQKQAALKRFMEAHPEMDFSNAKIQM